jgi:hypothetical protein
MLFFAWNVAGFPQTDLPLLRVLLAQRAREVQQLHAARVGETMPLDLDNLFDYHAPKPDQLPRYAKVRAAAKQFAQAIVDNTPASADQTAAVRKVSEAAMTANAAIAREL